MPMQWLPMDDKSGQTVAQAQQGLSSLAQIWLGYQRSEQEKQLTTAQIAQLAATTNTQKIQADQAAFNLQQAKLLAPLEQRRATALASSAETAAKMQPDLLASELAKNQAGTQSENARTAAFQTQNLVSQVQLDNERQKNAASLGGTLAAGLSQNYTTVNLNDPKTRDDVIKEVRSKVREGLISRGTDPKILDSLTNVGISQAMSTILGVQQETAKNNAAIQANNAQASTYINQTNPTLRVMNEIINDTSVPNDVRAAATDYATHIHDLEYNQRYLGRSGGGSDAKMQMLNGLLNPGSSAQPEQDNQTDPIFAKANALIARYYKAKSPSGTWDQPAPSVQPVQQQQIVKVDNVFNADENQRASLIQDQVTKLAKINDQSTWVKQEDGTMAPPIGDKVDFSNSPIKNQRVIKTITKLTEDDIAAFKEDDAMSGVQERVYRGLVSLFATDPSNSLEKFFKAQIVERKDPKTGQMSSVQFVPVDAMGLTRQQIKSLKVIAEELHDSRPSSTGQKVESWLNKIPADYLNSGGTPTW